MQNSCMCHTKLQQSAFLLLRCELQALWVITQIRCKVEAYVYMSSQAKGNDLFKGIWGCEEHAE